MQKSGRLAQFSEGFALLLLITAFIGIQVLIGGTRLVFSLPTYALLGLIGLLALFSLRNEKPAASRACLAVTAAFFVYIISRALFSPEPYIARSDLYSVLGGLVVYFFTACIFTSAKQRLFFTAVLLAFGLAHVAVGAIQFRDGNNFMPIEWLQRYDYGWRASGFYICPNHLAGLLEVVGIMGVAIVCWSRWPVWGKLLVGYAAAVCYVGLALTGSRGGYLSVAASFLVFAILSLAVLWRASRTVFWRIGGPAIAGAVVVTFAVAFYFSRSDLLRSRAANTFETTNIRVDLWKAALEQWQLQPILGTGSGTYLYFGRLFRTERMQRDPVYVHNDYLHLLAEYGLLGALGMTAFLAVHVWRGRQSFRRLGPKRVAVSPRLLSNALALNIGALAAVASYVVHSVFDFNLHIPANLLLMAFVFGLLANDGAPREANAEIASTGATWWRLVLPMLGLLLVIQAARLLPGEYFAERARAALRDDRPISAARFAAEGLRFDPQNPDLHFYAGLARLLNAERMEDPRAAASFLSSAITALEQAHRIAPRETIYALELATALDSARRFEEAERVYQLALSLDPKSASIRRYYEGHVRLWRSPPEAQEQPPADKGWASFSDY